MFLSQWRLLYSSILISLAHCRIHPGYHQEPACPVAEQNPDWMASIPDHRPLQLISIPGTHDTMARFGSTKFMLKYIYETQTMKLKDQLEAGIRALDIRCRLVDNQCHVYHQYVSQQASLSDVLDTCKDFLEAHPSEVILMRIKDNEAPKLRSNRTFEETFAAEYWNKYPDLFYKPVSSEPDFPTLPLQQFRGKVLILQYFKSSQTFGPNYYQTGVHESQWMQLSRATLYRKWIQVRDQLDKANTSASIFDDQSQFPPSLPFYSNWLSGSLTVEPYFVASGHQAWGTDGRRHTCYKQFWGPSIFPEFPRSEKRYTWGKSYRNVYCEGTNVMTTERLWAKWYRFVGMIFADFPGCGLIRAVIDVNKHF